MWSRRSGREQRVQEGAAERGKRHGPASDDCEVSPRVAPGKEGEETIAALGNRSQGGAECWRGRAGSIPYASVLVGCFSAA